MRLITTYSLANDKEGSAATHIYPATLPATSIDTQAGQTTRPRHYPRPCTPHAALFRKIRRRHDAIESMAAYQDFSPNFITRTRRVLQDNGARAGNLHGLTRLEDMNRSEPSRCRAGSTNTSFFHAGICHVPVTGAISLPRSLYGRIGLTAVKPVMRGLDFLN